MTEMLFGKFEAEVLDYDGPDLSGEIGNKWKCQCVTECLVCGCVESEVEADA